MGQHLLRISIQEQHDTIGFILEGRVAGPWAAELSRAWEEIRLRLDGKKFFLDLRSVTYSDVGGKRILREIVAQSGAELVTSSPWSEYLAEEISTNKQKHEEA